MLKIFKVSLLAILIIQISTATFAQVKGGGHHGGVGGDGDEIPTEGEKFILYYKKKIHLLITGAQQNWQHCFGEKIEINSLREFMDNWNKITIKSLFTPINYIQAQNLSGCSGQIIQPVNNDFTCAFTTTEAQYLDNLLQNPENLKKYLITEEKYKETQADIVIQNLQMLQMQLKEKKNWLK